MGERKEGLWEREMERRKERGRAPEEERAIMMGWVRPAEGLRKGKRLGKDTKELVMGAGKLATRWENGHAR